MTRNEPGTLVVWCRLSEIRLVQLSNLEQVGYDAECSSITLYIEQACGWYFPLHPSQTGRGTHRCGQTSGVANRHQVQSLPGPAALLNSFCDPTSTPLAHSPILPEVDPMHGPPRLDHLPSDLLNRGVGLDPRIEDGSNLVESSPEVNRSGSGEEEMIKERFDVVAELEWRRQEIGSWILSEGNGDIRRH